MNIYEHTVGNIYSWADVEELIRSLLPPKTVVDGIQDEWLELTPEESEWLQKVAAARVNLEKDKVTA